MTDEERREEKLKAFTERQQQRQAEIEKRRAQRLDGADPSEDVQAFFDAFKSRRAEIQVAFHRIYLSLWGKFSNCRAQFVATRFRYGESAKYSETL